jgi:hypothetical protein
LNGRAVVIAAVAAENEGRALISLKSVEDRLNEILKIMALLEDFDFLAQSGRARPLVGKGRRCDRRRV